MRASRSVARSPFRRLREFCEFWSEERPHLVCCQFADDELLTTEPELFDCGACAISCQLAEMDADNVKAWELAKLLLTRFVADAEGMAPWLLRLTPDLDEVAFADLLRRLDLIYDVLVPPPPRRQE